MRDDLERWLELHIFFGIVGPVLVTFHTSFKFNGLISVGYWLMMTVWASGFVGRYLYVRIPKTIRGVELSRDEIERGARRIATRALSRCRRCLQHVTRRLRVRPVTRRLAGRPVCSTSSSANSRADPWGCCAGTCARPASMWTPSRGRDAAAERASLARRLAHLERTRRLFELWHVFHRPLVYGLFVIVAVHVASRYISATHAACSGER